MEVKKFFSKKILFLLICFVVASPVVFCDDWILATQAFTFNQTGRISSSAKKASTVLPSLVLEQIASKSIRILPDSEVLDRKLDKLLTERLALFLQLSKENKERDSLVIKTADAAELRKALDAAEKKIAEIEKKIDENIAQEDKEIADYEKKQSGEASEKKRFWWFPFRFFRKDESNRLVTEKVSLYKNDTNAVFEPSEYAVKEGLDSYAFSKELQTAKINGLMRGSLSTYGNYVAVTLEIFVFPGAKSIGVVTEVGNLSDLMGFSKRIVQKLVPKIANSLPVLLDFAISPAPAEENAIVSIDGVVRSDFRDKIILDSGIHTVSISSDGYNTATVTYNFSGEEKFLVKANLSKKISGNASVELKNFKPGVFYTNGIEAAPTDDETKKAMLSINGKNVLGIFSVTTFVDGEADEERAFFRISEDTLAKAVSTGNMNFVVDANPFDRQAYIDKRRRAMYFSYALLICSMPYTFYNLGNFTSANMAYEKRGVEDSGISYDDLKEWQTKLYVSLGISAALGAWTVFELVRYLRAADQVLPADAKIAPSEEEKELEAAAKEAKSAGKKKINLFKSKTTTKKKGVK
ncbi:MAG: hypothetical protein II921_08535 [Treponema sp.]|nr:hypothetical protein [Treponema sp.]